MLIVVHKNQLCASVLSEQHVDNLQLSTIEINKHYQPWFSVLDRGQFCALFSISLPKRSWLNNPDPSLMHPNIRPLLHISYRVLDLLAVCCAESSFLWNSKGFLLFENLELSLFSPTHGKEGAQNRHLLVSILHISLQHKTNIHHLRIQQLHPKILSICFFLRATLLLLQDSSPIFVILVIILRNRSRILSLLHLQWLFLLTYILLLPFLYTLYFVAIWGSFTRTTLKVTFYEGISCLFILVYSLN